MAITVDWPARVITIPQADMVPLGGGVYELDLNVVRLALKALEDDEAGITFPDTHTHATEVTISGITYVRFVEFINGYTVSVTPDGGWVVSCKGANHNLADVYNNLTGPTLLPNNSAGHTTSVGSGLTPEEAQQLADIYDKTTHIQDTGEVSTKKDILVYGGK